MKFLLTAVNAKYIHSNPAVYSLRAFAGKELEKHIEIAEYTINQRTETILSDLFKRRPDVIAFSCYIWNWEVVRSLIVELPKILPEVPIWLGGPEVTFDAEKILKEYPMLTGVMIGEGEETFSELLKYYIGSGLKDTVIAGKMQERPVRLPEDIPGIVFRHGKETVSTGERKPADLDSLPFYYENTEDFNNRIIYYESSRGCPYRCSYCLSSIDKRVRFRQLGLVKQELQFFLDRCVAQVKFVDRTFNCDRERTKRIWEFLVERDNGKTNFHFEIAADLLTEEELFILGKMRPGLVQLEIGVQSVNPDTLREINRFTDMEKLKGTVERILAGKNVHVHLDLIAGLPWEDYASFGHSFDTVYLMGPHQLQLGFLKVLKGSPMHKKAGGYGINYMSRPPYEVLYSKWLSYEDICRLKQIEEMVELYYNSNQFTHTLPALLKIFDGPFAMFESLAAFYAENGYFTNSPSRLYRYEVLYSFAVLYDGAHEKLYCELLTFDLYLRENLKSRPDFAENSFPGSFADKARVRDFYEKEEKERKLLPSCQDLSARQLQRMSHLEKFHYAVWKESREGIPEKAGEEEALLFDYTERNALTGEARVIPVKL